MEESYRVGVTLALKGNVQTVIDRLVKQFGQLDQAIKLTQASTKSLSESMAALGREGRSAAQEWQRAAAAMERAAQSASRAGGAAMRSTAGGGGFLPAPVSAGGARPAVRSAGQPVYGPSGAGGQFQLVGPSYDAGPSRALVPVPGTQRTHDYARSPDRGSVVPYVAPGLLGAHLGSRGGINFPDVDEPFNADGRIPLYPNGRKGRFDPRSGATGGRGNYYAQGVSAYGGFAILKSMYEASAEIDDAKKGLQNQGFSIPEIEVIAKQSDALRKSVPGTSIAGNMAAFSKAQEVFQNTEEAIAATPEFIKFDRLMTATNHTKEGQDILNAFRLAEFRGAVMHTDPKTGKPEIDKAALKEVLDMVAASALMTNADIGPRQVLSSLRSAGTAGALVDNRTAFVDMMAMQIALGQSKAGTALQSFAQQFVFGRQSQTAINEMIHAGIIRGGGTAKTNKFVRPMAMGQYLLMPGAMPEGMGELARDQPVEFVEHYLRPVFQKVLAKEFGKKYTDATPEEKLKYETSTSGVYASRLPGSTFMAESIRNYLLVERDREANKKILERGIPEAYKTRINDNPIIQQQALAAAYKAFLTHLGDAALKPAIAVLNDLTQWLDKLGEWAKENPEKIKYGLEAFAGALALFAAGTLAAGALTVLTGTGGLVALAAGIEGLGKALTSIPGPVIDALAGAALGSRFGPIGAAVGAGAGAVLGMSHELNSSNYKGPPVEMGGLNVGTPFFSSPSAPFAPIPSSGKQGAPSDPVNVRVVNHDEMSSGVVSSQARRMNRPPDGPTVPNVNLSTGGAYFGSGWAPP